MKITPLLIKELKQLMRDPQTLLMVATVPALVMVLFGMGYGGAAGRVPVVVANLDPHGLLSNKLMEAMRQLPTISVMSYASSKEEAEHMVREGRAFAALVIPQGFTESFYLNREANLLVIVDVSTPTISALVESSMTGVVYHFQSELVEAVGGAKLNLIYNTVHGPKVTNLEAFTPLVVGIVLHLVPMSLISIAICREKERGTFEQLVMAPVTRMEVILGKLSAYFFVCLADMIATLMIAIFVFDVYIKGSLLDIMVISTIFLVGSLGLGMLISVLSKNQLQANQASIFIFIPALLFCGVFTPIEILSPVARVIATVNPLYYFVKSFKSIMIKGMSLDMLFPELGALVAFCVLTLTLAVVMLKLRVE